MSDNDQDQRSEEQGGLSEADRDAAIVRMEQRLVAIDEKLTRMDQRQQASATAMQQQVAGIQRSAAQRGGR